jgi:serine phosphatase RsbU (regulator of sigma subunit)
MADGQSSGKGAKWISTMVVRKVITLLSEGVRDGAAARAASDTLFTERRGKVSSTLNIVSIDRQTQTLVITRNSPSPALLAVKGSVHVLDKTSNPVGLYRDTRPVITEMPLEPGIIVVAYTDGLVHAGSRYGKVMDVRACLQTMLEEEQPTSQFIADSLLAHAMKLDQNRPTDDISVIVVSIVQHSGDEVRRMTVRLPLWP